MRVICAPDKFKQACTAAQAAAAMARGVRDASSNAEVIELPLADGGEGTLDVLKAAFPDARTARVKDSLGRAVEARFALSPDGRRALVESAQACGLWRLREPERNPLKTTTWGVGELIRHALDAGAAEIVVALGGSATSDGGAGMAASLGARFVDSGGKALEPVGGELKKCKRVEIGGLDARIARTTFSALCDVMTPMLGDQGATRKFILQKGGTTQTLAKIEEALESIRAACAASGIACDATAPGTGAAGGLGFGVAAFLGSALRPGAEAVLQLVGFDKLLSGTSLVLTGEGGFDTQTAEGKLIAALGAACLKADVPMVVLAGTVDPAVNIPGVTAAFAIAQYGARRQDNLNATTEALRKHSAQVVRLQAQ